MLALLIPAGQALALQSIGLSPTNQTVTLAPGASTSGQITVINDGDVDVTYKVYATDYGVTGESYQGLFTKASTGPDVSPVSWFKLPGGTFTIKPSDSKAFPYTISAPKTATVGGHYAAVFVETIPPVTPSGTHIFRVTRLGSLFYLTVSGALVQTGNLLPLQAPWLQTTSPLQASLRVSNTGNVHFLVSASSQLSSPFGKVGHPVEFSGAVLPKTIRRFNISLPASSPIGLYNMTVKVNYLGHNSQLSHWVLLVPLITFLIVVGTLLLLIVLGLWMLIRKARRRKSSP